MNFIIINLIDIRRKSQSIPVVQRELSDLWFFKINSHRAEFILHQFSSDHSTILDMIRNTVITQLKGPGGHFGFQMKKIQ